MTTKEIEGSATTPPVGPALPSERENIESALGKQYGGFVDTQGKPTVQFTEFSSVSAAVSRQIGRNAAIAVIVASIAITLYITWSFRNIANSMRYGISAIVALLHDVLLVVGVFSILGKFFNVEVDTFFITGLLTVVGFSVHDSIVVFDRVRENVARGLIRNFPDAVNHSLLQTAGRSFNTSLTLIFSILALLLLGGGQHPRLPAGAAGRRFDRGVQLDLHREHVPGDVAAGRHPARVAADRRQAWGRAACGGRTSRVTVGFVYDPLFLEHDTGDHPESAQRMLAAMALLEESGLLGRLHRIAARDATPDELALVHDQRYVAGVRRVAEQGGGWVDPDTVITPTSYDVAARVVGGTLAALDAVMARDVDSAFCLVRPPGHHATPVQAMGFCLFNHIAIAAEYARRRHSLDRVAIVDFDVHHGNGTQDAFYEDAGVLYVSTHEYPFYPGTGPRERDRRGGGARVQHQHPAAARRRRRGAPARLRGGRAAGATPIPARADPRLRRV